MPCTVSSWGPEPFQGSVGQISLLLTGTLTVDTSLHLSSSTSPSSSHLHLFQKKDLSFSEDEVAFFWFLIFIVLEFFVGGGEKERKGLYSDL